MSASFHFLFSGFSQRFSDTSNGLARCYRRLRARWPVSETLFLPWYVDPADLAALCAKAASDNGCPRISVAGYSFGGTTAFNLCTELGMLGIIVDDLVSIDAVKRRSLYPWGWASAFNRTARFRVPPNVLRATIFYQRQNWPRGHPVRQGQESVPQEVNWIQLYEPHAAMDNHALVQAAVMHGAKRLYDVA